MTAAWGGTNVRSGWSISHRLLRDLPGEGGWGGPASMTSPSSPGWWGLPGREVLSRAPVPRPTLCWVAALLWPTQSTAPRWPRGKEDSWKDLTGRRGHAGPQGVAGRPQTQPDPGGETRRDSSEIIFVLNPEEEQAGPWDGADDSTTWSLCVRGPNSL